MTAVYITIWFLVLLVIVYGVLVWRYCNRVVDNVVVLQCTHDTFQTELLDERQPLVCQGFEKTSVFGKLAEGGDAEEVYTRVRHLCPWFCSPAPVRTIRPQLVTQTTPPNYTVVDALVLMVVQTRGMANVWLVHPSHRGATPQYTEIVLREGTAVFVPYKWSYAITSVDESGVSDVRSSVLSWTLWFGQCV
jgi:hypothetical protein